MEKTLGAGNPDKAYPLYDGHGNMLATISLSGTISNQRTYDIWGGVRAQNGISTNPSERHVGNLRHKADDESGLIYMRARYYDPGSGRFVTEDPARDGANWFVYCNNDPVNLVDLDGKRAHPAYGVFWMLGWFATMAAIVASIDERDLKWQGASMVLASVAVVFFALAFNSITPLMARYYSPWISEPMEYAISALFLKLIASSIMGLKAGNFTIGGKMVVPLVFAYSIVLIACMVASEWD